MSWTSWWICHRIKWAIWNFFLYDYQIFIHVATLIIPQAYNGVLLLVLVQGFPLIEKILLVVFSSKPHSVSSHERLQVQGNAVKYRFLSNRKWSPSCWRGSGSTLSIMSFANPLFTHRKWLSLSAGLVSSHPWLALAVIGGFGNCKPALGWICRLYIWMLIPLQWSSWNYGILQVLRQNSGSEADLQNTLSCHVLFKNEFLISFWLLLHCSQNKHCYCSHIPFLLILLSCFLCWCEVFIVHGLHSHMVL